MDTDLRPNNTYTNALFLVSLLVLGLTTLLLLSAVCVTICCCNRYCATRAGSYLVAGLMVIAQLCFTILMGVVAGLDHMHPAVGFLISAILWIPTTAIYMLMTSPAWRTGFLLTKAVMKREEQGRELHGTSKEDTTPWPIRAAKSFIIAAYRAAVNRPKAFMLLTFFSLLYTLVIILSLGGVCYCTNPFDITTWLSRRASAHYCSDNEVCHLYAMVGRDASRMRLVTHIVSPDGVPTASTAVVCEVSTPQSSACLTSTSFTVTGSIIDHAHITEDLRYVTHTLLSNLTGSTYYRAVVSVRLGNGHVAQSTINFKSLPDQNSLESVELVGGGDYHTSDTGMKSVMQAIVRQGEPHLFYVGGDIAYGNNIRYCYLRWDAALHFFASLRTRSGAAVPLLMAAGNHESGGYEKETDPAKLFFYTQYFPHYDDDAPSDQTITYHSHRFGRLLGIVVLDSGCYKSASSQVGYFRSQLELMKQPTNTSSAADAKFVIAMYHNPAYPSGRALTDDTTPDVRQHFVPLLDEFKVPLALEHHDHMYKRTVPIRGDAESNTGTVYIGDGGLGIPPRSQDPPRRDLMAASGEFRHALHITVSSNGVARVDVVGIEGEMKDSVTLIRHL